MIFMGLGDSVSQNDPCTLDPTDPVCVDFYGSKQASEANAVASSDPSYSPEIQFDVNPLDCPAGTTWNATLQYCVSNSAPTSVSNAASAPGKAGPQIKVTSPASSAAAGLPAINLKTGLLYLAIAAVGYGGWHLYKKRRRK